LVRIKPRSRIIQADREATPELVKLSQSRYELVRGVSDGRPIETAEGQLDLIWVNRFSVLEHGPDRQELLVEGLQIR
jgi:hypothetical protein